MAAAQIHAAVLTIKIASFVSKTTMSVLLMRSKSSVLQTTFKTPRIKIKFLYLLLFKHF